MLRAFCGGTLYAQGSEGPGPLVVMLHGWARSSADFARLGEVAVAHGADVLNFDLPGFGVSPPPNSPWGSSDYAQAVAGAIAEHLQGRDRQDFFLLGHSFGGRVALALAATSPVGLKEVFVAGVPLFRSAKPAKPRLGYRILRKAANLSLVPKETLERYRDRHGSADYRNAQGMMRSIFVRVVNEDYYDFLSAIDVPCHLLWGELDSAAPLSQAKRALGLLRGGDLEVVSGGDHFAPIAAGGVMERALEAALARYRPQDAGNQSAPGGA